MSIPFNPFQTHSRFQFPPGAHEKGFLTGSLFPCTDDVMYRKTYPPHYQPPTQQTAADPGLKSGVSYNLKRRTEIVLQTDLQPGLVVLCLRRVINCRQRR